jgi:PTS system N-acetylgalactosamine-specific IIB component
MLMGEPNIKAVRLDERLIHGQGRLWISNLGVNLVIVANDEVAKSHIQQQLMASLMPESVGIRFFSLAEGGVPIKALNVGNIHMKDGKTRLTNFISVDADDLNALRTLHEKYHANLNTRTTPLGNDVGSDFDLNDYVATH